MLASYLDQLQCNTLFFVPRAGNMLSTKLQLLNIWAKQNETGKQDNSEIVEFRIIKTLHVLINQSKHYSYL